jgi:hypothetical protein
MFARLVSRFSRFTLAVLILAALALALPQPVSAAVPNINILGVKADESVTIRASGFPADVNFTVRMDVAGNLGIDGIVVKEFNSGKGGTFDATYSIPAELRGKKTLAIRLESSAGYFAYNWFNNRTWGTPPSGDTPVPVTGEKPYIRFAGVEQNESVTVEAFNFPPNVNLSVRVGPYYTFFRDYVIVTNVNSGSTGAFKFTINLPEVVEDEELVTVRLDGGGRYAFNAFKNVDSGTVTIPVTGGSAFQVISVTPGSAMPRGADFDAVWTIKNTSNRTWELSSVDYKFASGAKLHKRGDRYDLPQTVKPGETVRIIVDMVAPNAAGWYNTSWSLVEGNQTLGSLNLSLRVR